MTKASRWEKVDGAKDPCGILGGINANIFS